MDELASRLKDLDPSEIEKYLALLNNLKAQSKETTSADASSSKQVNLASPTPAVTEEGKPDATVAQAQAQSFAALPPEEVPFAFGEFGIQTLEKEKATPEKGEAKKRYRKKGLVSSSGGGKGPNPPDGGAPSDSSDGLAVGKHGRPSQGAPRGLASFGFFTTTAKPTDATKADHKLFSAFVPDKRIVPRALDFWSKREEAITLRSTIETAQSPAAVPEVCETAPSTTGHHKQLLSFQKWVDVHQDGVTQAQEDEIDLDASIARRHSSIPEPYKGFNRETIFTGFFAVGYEPCQARPAYFGTYNNLQEEGINGNELRQIGRFPLGSQMPRLSILDYDYDSGDDWDVLDGGEDVCMSSSGDSAEDDDTLLSSDLDFVASDDEEEGGDSESELQRKIMEARQQRLRRLRGKEKLISSHSGPFVGILPCDHPLRSWDRIDCLRSLADEALSEILAREMSARSLGATTAEEMAAGALSPHLGGAVEAALKHRRSMTEEETAAMHMLIEQNRMISTKAITQGFREKQLCIGVPRVEIERTVKRFYERKHGSLTAREEPWSSSDPRLFVKTTKKATRHVVAPGASPSATAGSAQPTLSPAPKADNENEEEDHDYNDAGNDADDEGSPTVGTDVALPAGVAGGSQQAPQTADEAICAASGPQLATTPAKDSRSSQLQEEEHQQPCGTKRPREDVEVYSEETAVAVDLQSVPPTVAEA